MLGIKYFFFQWKYCLFIQCGTDINTQSKEQYSWSDLGLELETFVIFLFLFQLKVSLQ